MLPHVSELHTQQKDLSEHEGSVQKKKKKKEADIHGVVLMDFIRTGPRSKSLEWVFK